MSPETLALLALAYLFKFKDPNRRNGFQQLHRDENGQSANVLSSSYLCRASHRFYGKIRPMVSITVGAEHPLSSRRAWRACFGSRPSSMTHAWPEVPPGISPYKSSKLRSYEIVVTEDALVVA